MITNEYKKLFFCSERKFITIEITSFCQVEYGTAWEQNIIHWVDATKSLDATIRLYDRLFTVPNPAAEDDFNSVINPDSLVTITGAKVEPSLAEAKAECAYQFERQGYFCLDNDIKEAGALIFNRTVGLRDTWAKISQQRKQKHSKFICNIYSDLLKKASSELFKLTTGFFFAKSVNLI